MELDVAVLFHVEARSVRNLYLTIGEDFVAVVLQPELASAVRGLTSEADASALYTSGRAEMQSKLTDELTKVLGSRGIVVESVLLKGVVLPDLLKASAGRKPLHTVTYRYIPLHADLLKASAGRKPPCG